MTAGRLPAGSGPADQHDTAEADGRTGEVLRLSIEVPTWLAKYVQDGPLAVRDSRNDLQGLIAKSMLAVLAAKSPSEWRSLL
jgi:hypothetical protein